MMTSPTAAEPQSRTSEQGLISHTGKEKDILRKMKFGVYNKFIRLLRILIYNLLSKSVADADPYLLCVNFESETELRIPPSCTIYIFFSFLSTERNRQGVLLTIHSL